MADLTEQEMEELVRAAMEARHRNQPHHRQKRREGFGHHERCLSHQDGIASRQANR